MFIEANALLRDIKNAKRYPWMAAPGVVMWEDWMSVPRTSRMEDMGNGTTIDGSPIGMEWVMVEDAVGRMKTVKRLVPNEEDPQRHER